MSAFLDTNILVYAYSVDRRRDKAQKIVADGGLISAQVLNEVTNVLRHKQKQEWSVVEAILATLRLQFPYVVPLTAELHSVALDIARRRQFRFYDALIVAAALEGGCDTLFSEDFQHGQVVEGLRVENPFL